MVLSICHGQKMINQRQDILFSVSQRRNLDGHHIKSVIKIFSKPTLFDHLF